MELSVAQVRREGLENFRMCKGFRAPQGGDRCFREGRRGRSLIGWPAICTGDSVSVSDPVGTRTGCAHEGTAGLKILRLSYEYPPPSAVAGAASPTG